jgi:hypothetical protein
MNFFEEIITEVLSVRKINDACTLIINIFLAHASCHIHEYLGQKLLKFTRLWISTRQLIGDNNGR